MATELAKAYVQIVPSAKGITESLKKEMDGEAQDAGMSAGNTMGSFIKKSLAAAGIGIAVKKIFSDAFSNGGELQQNLGGSAAVFGQYASSIQDSAKMAYKNMGMSASDYMATANKMGSLFQGSGVSQKQSLDMTSQAMQRAADVASVMGVDTSMAMESIAGAAKGNFTMMDNLGVAMNATTLQAYALEKGVNFNWNTASNAEKSEIAMKMFMDRTSQYANNFAKESESTWSGSLGAMSAAYENVMANIMLGEKIGPSLNALGQTVTTFIAGNFIPAVANILTALPRALITMITSLVPTLVTAVIQLVTQLGTEILTAAPQLYISAMQLIEQFKMAVTTQLPTLLASGVEMITSFVNGILSNMPIIIASAGNIVVGYLQGILQALPQIWSAGVQLVLNLVNGIVNNLPQVIASAVDLIGKFRATILQNMPQILQSGIELIGKLTAGLIQAIPNLIGQIPQIITSIKNAFTSVDWGSVGINITRGIANGIKNAASQIFSAIKDVASSALDAMKSMLGIKSPSRLFRDEVGKMISLGIASGIAENTNPITEAVKKAKALAISPFGTDDVATANICKKTDISTGNDGLLDRFDRLLNMMESSDNKQEVAIYLKERTVGRALRDMGVAFN